MKHKQYSVVRLTKLHKQFNESELTLGKRTPRIGDVATIVEVYEKPVLGYELECSDGNGMTEWLVSFSPHGAEFELIDRNK
jgi:hypothetical protein